MKKRILLTTLSLVLTVIVIVIGAVMPGVLSLISDDRLEHDTSLQTGDMVKLNFAKEKPSTALESVAYFSYLDSGSGRYNSDELILNEDRVKTIVYNFFTGGWSVEQLDEPITDEYNYWFAIVLPMVYSVRNKDDESFEEQNEHVFWQCFWRNRAGKRCTVWVDDSSASIIAFKFDLDDDLHDYSMNSDTNYNFQKEEKIMNSFLAVFRKSYDADSILKSYYTTEYDRELDDVIDVWLMSCTSTEQHNGVSSDSVIKIIVYFTRDGICFNLENPSRFLTEINIIV